ncbi:MAG TPA: threonine/serine dehydratase, partial [Gammaproteobacteria bacterium]|nr:threonine/serine dehydratase [Gammaproteobacteria bacterium]
GALNRLLQLRPDERRAGVVAFSSGNHAQAVALAARWLEMPATIVMPADAPKVKLERTRDYGAEVVLYDREREDREAIALGLAQQRGAAVVPPFDHPDIIAGQGTVGLELGRATLARQLRVDALYVPVSGGGLIAGCALGIKSQWPKCSVYGVEPRGFEDLAASLAAGERRTFEPGGTTLCDGLRAPLPGAITFAINRSELAGACAVDDTQVRGAMALAAEHLKVVVEPSGAAAFAAVLATPHAAGACIAVVLSGGNVDTELLTDVLRAHGAKKMTPPNSHK